MSDDQWDGNQWNDPDATEPAQPLGQPNPFTPGGGPPPPPTFNPPPVPPGQPAPPMAYGSPPPPPPPGQPGYGSYGYQQPGAQPYGMSVGAKPDSNLVWAILSTIMCCLPFGVVAIVYAAKVDSQWSAGDMAGAQHSSRMARNWSIAAASSIVVVILIYVLLLGIGFSTLEVNGY